MKFTVCCLLILVCVLTVDSRGGGRGGGGGGRGGGARGGYGGRYASRGGGTRSYGSSGAKKSSVKKTLKRAAIVGAVAYGTYQVDILLIALSVWL